MKSQRNLNQKEQDPGKLSSQHFVRNEIQTFDLFYCSYLRELAEF